MFQIQTRPTERLWQGKRDGNPSDLTTFAPLRDLVSWWQLGDYFGFLSGSFVAGVTGIDQGPANATLAPLNEVAFNGATDRGDNNGAGSFGPTSFTGRNDISTGNFNPASSFTITTWVKLTSEWDGAILSYSVGATTYWQLRYDVPFAAFRWTVLGASGAASVINFGPTGSPELNSWYLVECYYDAPTQTAGIRVFLTRGLLRFESTAITAAQASVPGGRNRTNANFRIGAQTGTLSIIGLICGVGFWSRRLNLMEVGTLNYPNDYPWQFFSPASEGTFRPYGAAGPAPSECFATGNPRVVYFTDNTDGAYQHEIWRDDGGGFFLLATLGNGVTEYQDDTAITEESALATEGGDTFQNEGGDSTFIFRSEVESRYKIRAIGYGEPSGFSAEFDPGTANFLGTQGNDPLTTEGGNPAILE